jgi:hypothetical protein
VIRPKVSSSPLLAFSFLSLPTALSAGCAATPPAREYVGAEPPTRAAAPFAFAAVPVSRLCVTAGRIEPVGGHMGRVNAGEMRAIVAGNDSGLAAEIEFTYHGPSGDVRPLGSGELRRQVGLKLRARDTCNVVYVMWHIDPTPGVLVSVKYNPDMSKNEECGPTGYINLKSREASQPPPILPGVRHILRAEVQGTILYVSADTVVVWQDPLPTEAFSFNGPAGVRSDNIAFDFELRVPHGGDPNARCPGSSPR